MFYVYKDSDNIPIISEDALEKEDPLNEELDCVIKSELIEDIYSYLYYYYNMTKEEINKYIEFI